MKKYSLFACAAAALLIAAGSVSAADEATYQITMYNLTAGQPFSPPVVFAHNGKFQLFKLGKPAGKDVWRIAEDGDNAVLAAEVMKSKKVGGYVVDDTPILPGESRTYTLTTDSAHRWLSICAMLGMTNDGFTAVTDVDLETATDAWGRGWDAGTEVNSESPETTAALGSPNVRDTVGAEGFVTIHRGIMGIGGIDRTLRDWKNPVLYVTIKKMK